MVTTIGYSSTSDKPSAPESPVDVDEQGTIAWEELLTAPVIQVESSETVQVSLRFVERPRYILLM